MSIVEVNFSQNIAMSKTKADKQMGAANLGAGQFDADRWAPCHFDASPVCCGTVCPKRHLGARDTLEPRHFGAVYSLTRRHLGARDILLQETLWRQVQFGAMENFSKKIFFF